MPRMPLPTQGAKIDYPLASLLAFTKVGNAVTFPEGSMMEYYDQLISIAEDAGMPGEMIKQTKIYSDSISTAIMAWAKKDNYAQTRSAAKYTVTSEDGRWIPTPPAYASGVEPHWMEVRCLVMDSAAQCKPVRPPKFDIANKTSVYHKALMEVKNAVDSITPDQQHIAEFWDDNPFMMNKIGHVEFATKKFSPPGHWMNIVGIAAQKAKADEILKIEWNVQRRSEKKPSKKEKPCLKFEVFLFYFFHYFFREFS
jgi:hypothetical protein